MKTHSVDFKQKIKDMGRQLKATITYGQTILEDELYSVTPMFQANLLKSVMKQLDLETSVSIPLNTEINCQIGIFVNDNYEMLDYGNYIVYKIEKQEDTDLYKITCYDKMLYAMKNNEDLGIEYPITIKNYLNAIGNKLGLEVVNSNFYNYNLTIPLELYLGLDYTYRDILDEIAQATGSMIIINSQDKLEVKYPNETSDTIDEEYLKDINVDFGQKYGEINTIVLSRSGESDNIYYPDPLPIDPVEIKIKDNQIMNFNNRSDFMPGIYAALNGIEYYINDFSSTGILYYEPGDFYNVQIGENTYRCLMLNDEIKVTTGIEELIHTDLPEQSETDYSKADKTDMRINQTYLIVDKQNQTIQSVVTNVGEQDNKISVLTQRVDEISSEVSDISGITITAYSNEGSVMLEGVSVSEPIQIKITPRTQSIRYIYPNGAETYGTFPSDTTYMSDRIIKFTNTSTNEVFTYELPDDLLWYDEQNYDEFILSYDTQTCQIIKRCQYDTMGRIHARTETIIDYDYPLIGLTQGNYTITIPGNHTAYLFVKLMGNNVYTDQFATKIEMNSKITQTAQQINLGVDAKLSNYSTTNEMNSAINIRADQITSTVSQNYETKDNAQTNYSRLTQTAEGLQSEVSSKVGNDEVISRINQSSEAISINANKIDLDAADVLNILSNNAINITSKNISLVSTNFGLTSAGNLTCNNAYIQGTIDALNGTIAGIEISNNGIHYSGSSSTNGFGLWKDGVHQADGSYIIFHAGGNDQNIGTAKFRVYQDGTLVANNAKIQGNIYLNSGNELISYDGNGRVSNKVNKYGLELYGNSNDFVGRVTAGLNVFDGVTHKTIALINETEGGRLYVYSDGIWVVGTVHTSSVESQKKNIEKYDKSALQEILNSDIYKYDLKTENTDEQKHIGLVIGENYKASKDVTDKSGVDLYSMIALSWKAIQEQQKEIEILKQKIEKLEKGGK